ncbi:MAG: autoinducer binding domain-containing protein [Pseudomonadota bacterium]
MRLQRYYDVSQAQDTDTFQRVLVNMAADMDFGLVTAVLVVENPLDKKAPVFHVIGNTPQGFIEASRDKDAVARDPVVKRMKTLSFPFTYDQELYVSESAGDLWEEQAAYGYRVGIGVALHLPNHQHFLLSMDRESPLPVSGDKITRTMADLQLLAVHAQAAATRLMLPLLQPSAPDLSTREIEVLRWTKAGKTAWEIGQILNLSESGVNYHLRSVFMKLDVVNKHQAVLRAMALGLLEP